MSAIRKHPYMRDPNSYANVGEARVSHIHLDLEVDFKNSVLNGFAQLTIEKVDSAATKLVLDTNHLTIHSVTLDGQPLQYSLGEQHEAFGKALTIHFNEAVKDGSEIRVNYATSPQASAIQWLPPAQTAGKVHPYLFTQCQAIHARSLLPCQDTPSNKCAYTGRITVPAPLVALMSAVPTKDHKDGDKHIYEFIQKVPIPSYLIAIAVGALESRRIGPRSLVWSEKETVDAGAAEFADTEAYIQAAENIVGPYVWGIYDILLLPPSFPYGGMENPCLTFVTPTLLAGDRSLANVVAHEIAHSWFGNFVGCHTWEHFWMNEGFTVFLERKILGALKGPQYEHLHATIGLQELHKSVERYGHEHPYTCLHVKLDGVDPDDAFSSVPYEKGYNLLHYLETIVGGPAVMNPFLKAHCERYQYSTANCEEWKEYFLNYFKGKVDETKLQSIDWDAWFNKPGMPPVAPDFDQTLVKAASDLAHQLVSEGPASNRIVDISKWESSQVVILLDKILEAQEGAADKVAFGNILSSIDSRFHFLKSKNAEIRFRWLTACVRSEMETAFPAVVQFLTEQGRMKYIRPLYRDLFHSTQGKQLAVETFQKHSSIYHSIAQKMVARDLELN